MATCKECAYSKRCFTLGTELNITQGKEADKHCRLYTPHFLHFAEQLVGKTVKIIPSSWGNTWNYKTVEYGKYLIGEIVSVTKTKRQTLIKVRAEHNVSWKRACKRYPISAIGKTVLIDESIRN